jgi:hypothetical protein
MARYERMGRYLRRVPDEAFIPTKKIIDKVNNCRHFWAGGHYRSGTRVETQTCVYCSLNRYQYNRHIGGFSQWS